MSRRVPEARRAGRTCLLDLHSDPSCLRTETTSRDEVERVQLSYTPGSGAGVSPKPQAPRTPSAPPAWAGRLWRPPDSAKGRRREETPAARGGGGLDRPAKAPVRFLPPTAGSVPTRRPSPRPAPPPTLGQVSGGQWASAGQVPANSRRAARRPWPGWAVLGGPGTGVGPGWTRKGRGRAQPPGRRGSSQHRTEPPPGAARSAAEAGVPGRALWPDSAFARSHAPRRPWPGSPTGAERGRAGGGGEGC